MKLHRTSGTPDWIKVSTSERNIWQRLAYASGGIVTVPNLFTLVGLAAVIYGLVEIAHHHYWWGVVALAVGRLCDLADGLFAEMTGTKSPLGELLDATADKISTFLTVFVLFVTQIAPWWTLLALVAPHVIISVVIAIKRMQRTKIHPSRIGKLSMAAAWLALLGLVILSALAASWPHPAVITTYLLVVTSFVSGLYVAVDYARQR